MFTKKNTLNKLELLYEHIKSNKVANMCYTTLMSKKEPLQLEILPFFFSFKSSSVFSAWDTEFHGRPLRLCL